MTHKQMKDFFNNEGRLVFRSTSDFTKTAEKVLDDTYPRVERHHLRVGPLSIVVVPGKVFGFEGDVIAAQAFDDFLDCTDEPRMRSDRMGQLSRIQSVLKVTHPMYAKITQAIAIEMQRWRLV